MRRVEASAESAIFMTATPYFEYGDIVHNSRWGARRALIAGYKPQLCAIHAQQGRVKIWINILGPAQREKGREIRNGLPEGPYTKEKGPAQGRPFPLEASLYLDQYLAMIGPPPNL